jgi:mono/diheme cytochrome c family protein
MSEEISCCTSQDKPLRKMIPRPLFALIAMIAGSLLGIPLASCPAAKAAQSEKASDALEKPASSGASANVGDAERGKELFVKDGCYECHGYQGQGGSYTGPRIAPDPLPWEAIAAFIRNPPGVNSPATKDSAMPPYTSKMIPDKDVQDIYAYLKAIPAATDRKNIPSYKK